jgi:DNA-binding cell septation regulator SpoVG
VSDVRFCPAGKGRSRAGLIGFASFLLDGCVRVDGVAVRRTAGGVPALSFPARRDRQGRDHPYIRPIDDETRLAIELQVLEQLGQRAQPEGGP